MEAEAYLNRLPMWANKKNSLKDIRIFLDQMGGPDRKIPAIHVAGTNGKGSVCAFMTSVLKKAGLRTGTFISPHLVEIRERFLINGEPAEKNAFEEAFETVKKQAEHMVEEGFCHPTFFEFLFYMAMVLFAREKVDVMVIETGLGGRLDATNVLESPKVCVITSISRDHMQYLGNPLPGDYLYCPDYSKISRTALHSYRLAFCHPITGNPMDFYAPLPTDMTAFFQ